MFREFIDFVFWFFSLMSSSAAFSNFQFITQSVSLFLYLVWGSVHIMRIYILRLYFHYYCVSIQWGTLYSISIEWWNNLLRKDIDFCCVLFVIQFTFHLNVSKLRFQASRIISWHSIPPDWCEQSKILCKIIRKWTDDCSWLLLTSIFHSFLPEAK